MQNYYRKKMQWMTSTVRVWTVNPILLTTADSKCMLLKAQILKESLVHCGTCSCMSYVCITLTNHAYKPHLLLQHVYVCGASCVIAARDLKRRLQYERFAMDSTASSIVMLDCYGSLPVDSVSLFSSTNDSLVPPFTDSQESDTSSVLVFDFQSD